MRTNRLTALHFARRATSWDRHTSPALNRATVALWDIVGASAIVAACYPASEWPRSEVRS